MPRLHELLTVFLITVCVAVSSSAHAGVLASYDLNGITNAQISSLQYQTGNQLVYGATLTDWTKSGFNAVHAIQLSGTTPGGPGNYAIMIFGDNLITQQTAFAANDLGKTYYATYDIGPTVYADGYQATQAGDQLRINLLRGDNSILASSVVAPGAWQGVQTFSQAYFSYVGDGSGPLRLQMLSEQPGNGRFSGAVDNMAFWDTVPVPEPSTYAMAFAGIACGGFSMWRRRKRA
jgi:hypothetical protein